MRLIFMGTPDFAVCILQALVKAGHEIVCAYSQPSRPAGRGMGERPSPVQAFAQVRGLEVRTPVSLKSIGEQNRFAALKADAAVVTAYGLLLPKPFLNATRLGCFNVHASLLPRWRGAAPIQRAVMAGDGETGITIMRMEEGLDTGAICNKAPLAISPEMTAQMLHDALASLGARLMVETLAQDKIDCVSQPASGVTYANKIDKTETRIDFTRSADKVRNHIHGLSPFPGAWFQASATRIKVLACKTAQQSGTAGTCLDNALTIACGENAVRLLTLQRQGKGPLNADAFLRGFPIPAGTRLS
ncbi:MAG: methionyl-tRNA formyltransferase [Aestuariivirga sp.]